LTRNETISLEKDKIQFDLLKKNFENEKLILQKNLEKEKEKIYLKEQRLKEHEILLENFEQKLNKKEAEIKSEYIEVDAIFRLIERLSKMRTSR
jgi:hypothetical protein